VPVRVLLFYQLKAIEWPLASKSSALQFEFEFGLWNTEKIADSNPMLLQTA
jgi:hypothetical protein